MAISKLVNVRSVVVAGCMLATASCASSPDSCDPTQVGSVFTAASCDMGGGFQERQRLLDAQLAEVQRTTFLTQAEVRELERQANRLAQDNEALRVEQRRQADANAELRREIQALNRANAIDDLETEQLQAQLDALSEEELRLGAATTPEEIAEIQAAIEEKRRELDALKAIFSGE